MASDDENDGDPSEVVDVLNEDLFLGLLLCFGCCCIHSVNNSRVLICKISKRAAFSSSPLKFTYKEYLLVFNYFDHFVFTSLNTKQVHA